MNSSPVNTILLRSGLWLAAALAFYLARLTPGKRVHFWILVGAALMYAAMAKGDGVNIQNGSGTITAGPGAGALGDGSVMVPVVWDNEAGGVVEIDCLVETREGGGPPPPADIAYTLYPAPGVSQMTYIYVPASGCVFQTEAPSDPFAGDIYDLPLDLSGTNINYVTLVAWGGPGGLSVNGFGGASIVTYGLVRPDQVDTFYWTWFLAGWGLSLTAIAFQLVFRQIRNLGADAPTM